MSATITPNSPQAWIMSVTLHVTVLGVIALFTYATRLNPDVQPRVLELVAGPGDDYTAREAPALGSETAVKLAIPKATPTPPAPTPPQIQPQPVQAVAEPTPATPAPPVKKEEPKKTTPKVAPPKDIAKDLKSRVQSADRKAKKEAAIERKKEEARLTKAEFDRLNAQKKVASATPPKGAPSPKYKPIDTKGIAAGVVGGSSASTKGAGGKALTREEATLLELYDAEFRRQLRIAFEEDRPPGLSDSLVVKMDVRSNPDGSLTNPKVTQSSGSSEFDRAVISALRRMKMPLRPDSRAETISFTFRMREPQ